MPQGLVKSGLVAGLAGSIPPDRRDPSLDAVQAAAFAGNVRAVREWADARSSITKLDSVTTPVFMAQGRRDFLFGIDQGARAFRQLRSSPKLLYVGLHGHAPSSFPAADTGGLMETTRAWFNCYLLTPACDRSSIDVAIAPEKWAGRASQRTGLPPTRPTSVAFPGVTTFARSGKAVRTSAPIRSDIEMFGTPTVKVSIGALGGWSRLVAVLTARTPRGSGDRRQRRWRADEARRAERDDQSREPGDVPPQGIAAHAHARLVFDRAGEREPPLPRSPDGAERSGTRRHGRPQAAGTAHTGHEVIARAAVVALAALALVDERRRRHGIRPRCHVVDRPPRRHRPADRRGGGVRNGRAWREGLLRLREREGRCQRPNDRVPLLGRRLQPGADRPAHTPARRAGQGVRRSSTRSARRTTSRSATT